MLKRLSRKLAAGTMHTFHDTTPGRLWVAELEVYMLLEFPCMGPTGPINHGIPIEMGTY